MEVEYSEDKKNAFFDGYNFRRDAKTGYYLANKPTYNGRRERLHVYVWRYYNGPVPEGFHIHHKDEDKGNNDIENLACVKAKPHVNYHLSKYVMNHHDEMLKNLEENVRPKAAEWHRSEEGRAWHRRHVDRSLRAIIPTEKTCEYCGKKYMTIDHGNNKFCSNNCRAAARRRSGVDDEERTCAICGQKFTANKYSSKKLCSEECAAQLRENKKRGTVRKRASV